ncbi:MAG: dihydrofolate reductase family protein [Streptosporangiaceae bacterium]
MARTLLAHDLIDEMRLMIDPIVVGRGKRLFPDDATEPSRLRLSDSQVTLLAGAWRCRPAVTGRDASEENVGTICSRPRSPGHETGRYRLRRPRCRALA